MKVKKTLSADTSSKDTVAITNSSGDSLNVLSSFNTSDQESNSLYENTLTLFPASDDRKEILDKETAVVTLTGNTFTTRAGEKRPGFLYSLMFVNPNSFSPIGLCTVSNLGGSYPPISVTQQQREQMVLAKKFYQRVLAYPTSELATEFKNALDRVKDLGEIDAVDTFFHQNLEYETLNFDSVMMEISYMNNCVSFWGSNKESFIFYLYTPWDEHRLENTLPKFIGTLEFTKTPFSSDVIDIRKMYTITFKGEDDLAVPVDFAQRSFKSKNVDLTLAPVLILQSKVSGDIKDDSMIVTLVGSIREMRIIGVTERPNLEVKQPDPVAVKDWSFFKNPTSFAQIATLTLSVLGVMSLLAVAAKAAWWRYNKGKGSLVTSNPPKTPEEEHTELAEMERQTGEEFENVSQSFAESATGMELIRDRLRMNPASWDAFSHSAAMSSIGTTYRNIIQNQIDSADHLLKSIRELEVMTADISRDLLDQEDELMALKDKLRRISGGALHSDEEEILSGIEFLEKVASSFETQSAGYALNMVDSLRLKNLQRRHNESIERTRELIDAQRVEKEQLEARGSREVRTLDDRTIPKQHLESSPRL